MSPFFLDITDSQITLVGRNSIIQSPGAALANGNAGEGSLAFGKVVFETLKRRPLETRTDFWAQLSTAPLNGEFAGARHSADLVYEHLKFLFAEAERQAGPVNDVVIIAPSSLNQTQLELLLGILNAVGKPPSNILDRALVHQSVAGKAGVHLDLQWRQVVATDITLEDDQLVAGKSSTLPGNGYLDLLEQCLEHCADMCVEQTRFDPRRSADAEQLLFNAIPNALATLTHSEEASLSVSGYDFTVSRAGLEFIGKRLMAAVKGASGAVSVDGLLAGLPGVRFDSTSSQTTLAKAAKLILDNQPPEAELSRISRAKVENPWDAETLSPEAGVTAVHETTDSAARTRVGNAMSASDFAGPTHILINSRAYSIVSKSTEAQDFGLIIEGGTVQVAQDYRSQVNVLSTESSYDQLLAGCRLYRNDGTEALLIRVEG
jgi:hypothetical protein